MIIDSVLKDEKMRNEKMRVAYMEEIKKLPKGSLYIKIQNEKTYCYLRYRQSGKVISEYAGMGECAQDLQSGIDRRRHLQKMLRLLNEECLRIIKMERIK